MLAPVQESIAKNKKSRQGAGNTFQKQIFRSQKIRQADFYEGIAMTTFENLYKNSKNSPEYLAAGIQLDVARMIEDAMQRRNVSNAYLAKTLGCSRAYVTKLLKGDQNFSILSLAKVATALECELRIAMPSVASAKAKQPPASRLANKQARAAHN